MDIAKINMLKYYLFASKLEVISKSWKLFIVLHMSPYIFKVSTADTDMCMCGYVLAFLISV